MPNGTVHVNDTEIGDPSVVIYGHTWVNNHSLPNLYLIGNPYMPGDKRRKINIREGGELFINAFPMNGI
ncbi:hypothetical protein GCM10023188_36900 [Pontibacter saemangeumensis]|uniref:Uncharacterized protein n=1 Tax=Pontibacter saemangeumensis TaxID=1084525 RepID=A0ABP8LY23_9BACT